MIEACIFGDEELDDSGKYLVEKLKGITAEEFIQKLLCADPETAADSFLDLIGSFDYLWAGSDADYFKNVSAILFTLAEKPGFYKALLKCRDSLNGDEFPSRASLVVYSQ